MDELRQRQEKLLKQRLELLERQYAREIAKYRRAVRTMLAEGLPTLPAPLQQAAAPTDPSPHAPS